MQRVIRTLVLLLASVASLTSCGGASRVNAGATKPMSPAEGAGDYKHSPGGPHETPIIPTPGGEPNAGEVTDCPPKCNAAGAWIGCGLKKPRGSACEGCTPTCKGKGTADEGWYDCTGMLIVQRKCG